MAGLRRLEDVASEITKTENTDLLYIARGGLASKINIEALRRSLAVNEVGALAPFARSTAPTGWLKANGATVSRSDFSDLFSQIGVSFGAGDGSTTFGLPDLRGVVPRGWDDGRGLDAGRAFGSYQPDAVQDHNHQGLHLVDVNPWGGSTNQNTRVIVTQSISEIAGNRSGPMDSGNISVETRMKNIALLWCIKY